MVKALRRGAGDGERGKRSGVTSRRQADRYAQARHFRPLGRLMFLQISSVKETTHFTHLHIKATLQKDSKDLAYCRLTAVKA